MDVRVGVCRPSGPSKRPLLKLRVARTLVSSKYIRSTKVVGCGPAGAFYERCGWRRDGPPRRREWHGARLVEPRYVKDLRLAPDAQSSGPSR